MSSLYYCQNIIVILYWAPAICHPLSYVTLGTLLDRSIISISLYENYRIQSLFFNWVCINVNVYIHLYLYFYT